MLKVSNNPAAALQNSNVCTAKFRAPSEATAKFAGPPFRNPLPQKSIDIYYREVQQLHACEPPLNPDVKNTAMIFADLNDEIMDATHLPSIQPTEAHSNRRRMRNAAHPRLEDHTSPPHVATSAACPCALKMPSRSHPPASPARLSTKRTPANMQPPQNTTTQPPCDANDPPSQCGHRRCFHGHPLPTRTHSSDASAPA
ncbi:hypothetical protein B0H13DRAFT_2394958 [Mycena leptocephala]|nr:hypothetical protein B0H13DRAFT_2394958 [Mycena leptocephala]